MFFESYQVLKTINFEITKKTFTINAQANFKVGMDRVFVDPNILSKG
ncbi:hypothetical protein B488_03330 [Liberibacter crescens BT-1]|uniref:Uncharacterized protein n=1 Tax=Liberibacter crescens (strain BT-1) TaxID=1215343 RepID=L0EVA4_LIBCB|nr:hypothetical protein B488_03330 [Liberibacter crescens BT-1]